jgi:hypothetical protein
MLDAGYSITDYEHCEYHAIKDQASRIEYLIEFGNKNTTPLTASFPTHILNGPHELLRSEVISSVPALTRGF